MQDLHLAYLKSSIPNQDVPQDHIFFSSTYHYANKNNIHYILSGGNIASESVSVDAWHGDAMVNKLTSNPQEIWKKQIKKLPASKLFDYYFWYPFVKKMKTIRPLNFLPLHQTRCS